MWWESGLPQARPGAGRGRLGSLQDGPGRRGCPYQAAHPRQDSEPLQVRVEGNSPGRGLDGWRCVPGYGGLSLGRVRLGDFDLGCSER